MTAPDPAAFWDRHAARYARMRIRDDAAYEATLAHVRRHLGPTDAVLEIGCGTGTTALRLAGDVASYTGTDVSGAMIAIAEDKRRAAAMDTLRFLQAEASGAALPEAGFDAALAFNLLHLLDDLPGTLRHLHGLLKPGGRLISKTPCLGETTALLRLFIRALRGIGLAPSMRFLTGADLERAMGAAGFEIVETARYPEGSSRHLIVARRA